MNNAGPKLHVRQVARTWPCSDAGKLIAEMANEALAHARQEWDAARALYNSRSEACAKVDGLPELGEGFIGAKIEGDEWVEVMEVAQSA